MTALTSLERVPPLLLVTGRQYAMACGALYDDVSTGSIAHRGQPALDDAVVAARRRAAGDAWAWARPEHGTDPSPLIAATLARYGWRTRPRSIHDLLDRATGCNWRGGRYGARVLEGIAAGWRRLMDPSTLRK